jgi:hypothetical protein
MRKTKTKNAVGSSMEGQRGKRAKGKHRRSGNAQGKLSRRERRTFSKLDAHGSDDGGDSGSSGESDSGSECGSADHDDDDILAAKDAELAKVELEQLQRVNTEQEEEIAALRAALRQAQGGTSQGDTLQGGTSQEDASLEDTSALEVALAEIGAAE